ncbi:hypothetical protein RGQ15_21870 [Paracoccus sp. MBLB3053]|uniref:DUF4383 domain-containing protein n=1 Tax=Paracoccus aurantius TaxID=3073814 RepID=A0ABU2HYS8_9RHOB|nr:hypothetical protein [Paracoccus sp. MBLB3053]MDS9470200.1 hypothetical protein [Paracoccus sp. MBLB3053]
MAESSGFLTTTLRAGLLAALVSGLVLGVAAMLAGHPFWMPLNVTTQAFFGPEVALVRGLDLTHSGFGLLIHVVSSLFWAVIATLLFRGIGHAWIVGLGTALLALVVDYGFLPEWMSPGWHLAMPFIGVVAGFVGLGIGLGLGLSLAVRPAPVHPVRSGGPAPVESETNHGGPDALRHPGPNVIDQRLQRIDPANLVTEDPNRQGHGPNPPHKVTN